MQHPDLSPKLNITKFLWSCYQLNKLIGQNIPRIVGPCMHSGLLDQQQLKALLIKSQNSQTDQQKTRKLKTFNAFLENAQWSLRLKMSSLVSDQVYDTLALPAWSIGAARDWHWRVYLSRWAAHPCICYLCYLESALAKLAQMTGY